MKKVDRGHDMYEDGQLWGWTGKDVADGYAQRTKSLMDELGGGMTYMYSHKIKFPEHGLTCIQTEIWIKNEAGET